MDFQEVVRKRRMVRSFAPQAVSRQSLLRALANATRAPSAGFTQGWAFLVCESDAERARFWEAEWPPGERKGRSRAESLLAAPAIIVPLTSRRAYLERYAEPDKTRAGDDEAGWTVPYWWVDAGFATLLILLTAVDQGLGAAFFRLHHASTVCDAFGVPPEFEPLGAVALGYPAADWRSPSLARGRRPLESVVHWGAWGAPPPG